jgi:hypothetical protein
MKQKSFSTQFANLTDTKGCEQANNPNHHNRMVLPVAEFPEYYLCMTCEEDKGKNTDKEVRIRKGVFGCKKNSIVQIDELRFIPKNNLPNNVNWRPQGKFLRSKANEILKVLEKWLLSYDFNNIPFKGAVVEIETENGIAEWLALADWISIPLKDKKTKEVIGYNRRTLFISLLDKKQEFMIRTFDSLRIVSYKRTVEDYEVEKINTMLIRLIVLYPAIPTLAYLNP